MATSVTSTGRPAVLGDIAAITLVVSAAATGDTLDASKYGFTIIDNVIANPPASVAVIVNISGTTITYVYTGGGAMTGIQTTIIGRY